ncbi:glycosyltransferase family 4 protein [Stieleria sp. ICT_E10.1]|uniref:glycosyltransferase family 4 protein n=1 Tax=Stieleria sedimenti TaxID=2976331 RepID=UPI00217F6D6B|nr:glycosyltransferase family 4 protein [Stieleria sedimenti]MCS7466750.1 glycosyltransferase family 4 protein [Stieleria sedimenti]
MRILYHHRTLADGAEGIHIREMVSAFRGLGHQVRVVSLVDEQAEFPSVSSAAPSGLVHHMKRWLPRVAYEFAELGYNFVGKHRLGQVIKEFQPDLIYDRYNTFCNAAVNAGRSAGIPVFLEVNSPLAYERVAHDRGLFFPRLARQYESSICRLADHVFAVSTPLREFLISEHQLLDERVSVLPNGANPMTFSVGRSAKDRDLFRKSLGIPADSTVIGFTGILRPWHGVESLCSAFHRLSPQHPSLHLLLVGDGPSESAIRKQIGQLGITDRVTLTGRVAHKLVRDYVAAMDIAVSPRATFYASPMKILEYMGMGIPVVAPDMPNIRDLARHNQEAFLFRHEDDQAFLSALSRMILNKALRDSLGAAGRRRVLTELNWNRNAERVVQMLETLGE